LIGLGSTISNNNPPAAAPTRHAGFGFPGFVARSTPLATPSAHAGGVVSFACGQVGRLSRTARARCSRLMNPGPAAYRPAPGFPASPPRSLADWLAGAFVPVALAAA